MGNSLDDSVRRLLLEVMNAVLHVVGISDGQEHSWSNACVVHEIHRVLPCPFR